MPLGVTEPCPLARLSHRGPGYGGPSYSGDSYGGHSAPAIASPRALATGGGKALPTWR
jgi:hypothetical protein